MDAEAELNQLGGLLRCNRIKIGRCSLQWPEQFISALHPRFASCRDVRPDPENIMAANICMQFAILQDFGSF